MAPVLLKVGSLTTDSDDAFKAFAKAWSKRKAIVHTSFHTSISFFLHWLWFNIGFVSSMYMVYKAQFCYSFISKSVQRKHTYFAEECTISSLRGEKDQFKLVRLWRLTYKNLRGNDIYSNRIQYVVLKFKNIIAKFVNCYCSYCMIF